MATQDIPDWLIGRGITTIKVTPMVYNASTGLLDDTGQTIYDFFAVVDRIGYSHETVLERVSPMTSRQINNVFLESGGTITITEILRTLAVAGTPPVGETYAFNSLALLAHTFDHFRCVFTRGTKSYTGYYVNGGYDEDIVPGKCTGVMRFAPVGTVEATGSPTTRNPAYA